MSTFANNSGSVTPRQMARSRSSSTRIMGRRSSQMVSGSDLMERLLTKRKAIKSSDENIFKIYWADHTYTTLRLPMDTTVEDIVRHASDKLCISDGDDLVLCEVKSTGERVIFKESDLCVTPGLSINGRLFMTPREHIDALTPLPEQEGPPNGSGNTLEAISSREIAYQLTLYDWELFTSVHEYELIYLVFGRHKFRRITANLDVFLRRFNEIQYWVVSEMCLSTSVSKRVQLLRKFIKIASYCKEYQNLNSFFAIIMGLSNIAVSRLSQTWEKLPNKFKKMFAEFELMMEPSRNHRSYRLAVAKMVPPVIPFTPLLMKDMTFTHEGNKTHFDGLVNFEKMHMIAQTLRTIQVCRSKPLALEPPPIAKNERDARSYVRNLKVIDNQRVLTQLSHKLDPRRS